jgi:hypothetical protein
MALNNPHLVEYDVSMEVPTTTSTNYNMFPPENVLERHQHTHHLHDSYKISMPNSSSIFEMDSQQTNTCATKNHILSCHRLNKMICKNNRCVHKSPIRHGPKRHVYIFHTYSIDPLIPSNKVTRIKYPRLKQTLFYIEFEPNEARETRPTKNVHLKKGMRRKYI